MKIEAKRVVNFHCDIYFEDGELAQSTRQGESLLYLHGAKNMLPGLEKALDGREKGDRFEVTLAPVDAYGERNEQMVQRVPLKHLKSLGKPKPGMRFRVPTDGGNRDGVIVKVGRFVADVDMNHPFAGKTLKYDVEVIDVREATEEEIGHGHAHRGQQ